MIEFANKLWLYLLPVAVVLLLLLFQLDGKGRKASIRRFASGRLLQELLQSYSPIRRRVKNTVILLGVTFLFLALARPQWGYTWTESTSRGIDIVFALDTSRSMLAQDIKPNRLIRAKLAIEDFVNQLEGDRIGLVAFSGSAFLQCPLTLDYDAFFQSLDAVDTNVISAGGTDLAAAIKEAESAFSKDNNYKIVILITDGEDLEGFGITQAQKSFLNGVTIYSVGVGTPEGAPIPIRSRTGRIEYVRDENGEVVQSHLEPETLEEIAQITTGFYVPLGTTGYGLEQVLEAGVGSIPEEEISSQLQRTAVERFQWPLGIALFFFALEPLIGTRRRKLFRSKSAGTLPVLALVVALGAGPLQDSLSAQEISAPPPVESADEIPVEDEPEPTTPATPFELAVASDPLNPVAHFNRGTELYDQEDYTQAAESFTESLRLSRDFPFQADVFYNLGNTHYRQGLVSFIEASPGKVTDEAATVSGQNQPPMTAGQQILDAASYQPPPQEQIQQVIGALEQRKTATEESIQTLGQALERETSVQQLWQRSLSDFESALELVPNHDDARHNLEFVKQQAAGLAAQIATQQRMKEDQDRQIQEIERLIEELKKLLEEQENQQDQQQDQQQNQDQQQQQQDQQDQSQQDSSEEQQQNQDQEQQSGQQDQDPQGGQQNDQNQGQQDQQSQESSPQDQQEGDDPSQNPAQPESGEDPEQGEEPESSSEEEGDSQEEESPESMGEEEESSSAESQDGGDSESPETEEGGAGEMPTGQEEAPMEPIKLSEEQADEIAEELAASAAEEGDDSLPPGEEVVIGVMSTEDAARLLDSLKSSERKLPFAGSRSEGSPERNNRKNW
ncbi:MAG: VWA domain-containing protein [Puniceicoccales bacterium]